MKNDIEKKIEFVRNAVIMANNSECKTLEEFYKQELKKKNSKVFYKAKDGEITEYTRVDNFKTRNSDYSKYLVSDKTSVGIVKAEYDYKNFFENITFEEKENGRYIFDYEITLEKLFIALQNKKCFCFNFLGNNLIEFKLEFHKGYFRFIPWELNKTLELQSEKTIEELARIFGYSEKAEEQKPNKFEEFCELVK